MVVNNTHCKTVNRQRRAGVLLHPTSLPGDLANGDIGHQAYRFIEFLHVAGFKVWQVLPLGPTHDDNSPYQCLSSHAGDPHLISLEWLEDKSWLIKQKIKTCHTEAIYRKECLQQAGKNFYMLEDNRWQTAINDFNEKHDFWLDDYALFVAFKIKYENAPWYEWPAEIRHRDMNEIAKARVELADEIKQIKFEQFVFFTQWHEVREYAKKHDIEIFGDMPIFVARDSSDVWAQRENFLMNSDGEMTFVSGVPPDAFSESGQRWGNPLYNWEQMRKNKFSWWIQRFESQLELFDIVRIDHFRGLVACWQIPDTEETAINGSWVDVPGKELLSELFNSLPSLSLVAEDLGVITDEVIDLKKSFNLPGMKVLQFAFDGNNNNPHLPHHHEADDVVYTGTHDNDTTLGWAGDETNYNKEYLDKYAGVSMTSHEQQVWTLIQMAMASVSFLSVIPFQDILMLDSSARMNMPGTVGGNWGWRFEWAQLDPVVIEKFKMLMYVYQR